MTSNGNKTGASRFCLERGSRLCSSLLCHSQKGSIKRNNGFCTEFAGLSEALRPVSTEIEVGR